MVDYVVHGIANEKSIVYIIQNGVYVNKDNVDEGEYEITFTSKSDDDIIAVVENVNGQIVGTGYVRQVVLEVVSLK